MTPDPTSLDRLHDIVAAPAVPWWPPAVGWYWLFGLLFLLLIVLLLRSLLLWQHNRYRREALAELATHESALTDPARRAVALSAMAELLKRAALTAFPREQVATLTGPAWFAFLDRTGRTAVFSEGRGATLEDAAYDSRGAASLDEAQTKELASVVRAWLTHHRVEAVAGPER